MAGEWIFVPQFRWRYFGYIFKTYVIFMEEMGFVMFSCNTYITARDPGPAILVPVSVSLSLF